MAKNKYIPIEETEAFKALDGEEQNYIENINKYHSAKREESDGRSKNRDQFVTAEELKLLANLFSIRPMLSDVKKGKAKYNDKIIEGIKAFCEQYYADNNKPKNTPFPMIFRKILFSIVVGSLVERYGMFKDDGHDYEKANYKTALLTQSGMKRDSFEQWGFVPQHYYESVKAGLVKLGINRAGKKSNDLLGMIAYIVNDENPARFIDVFGGTGIVSASVISGKANILNDRDLLVWNFLDCAKNDARKIMEILKGYPSNVKTEEILEGDVVKEFLEALEQESRGKGGDREIAIRKEPLMYLKYAIFIEKFWSEVSGKPSKHKETLEDMYKAGGLELACNKEKRFEIAAAWIFRHSFRGFKGLHVSKRDMKFEQFLKWRKDNFEDEGKNETLHLREYTVGLKDTEIRNEDFRKLLKEADQPIARKGRGNIRPEDTLVYLAPPYFNTLQYEHEFSNSQHLEMLEWLRNTRCRWIMSCRDQNKDRQNKGDRKREKKDAKRIKDLANYFGILMFDSKADGEWLVANIDKKANEQVIKASSKLRDGIELYVYKIKEEKESRGEILITNFKAAQATRSTYKAFYKHNTNRNKALEESRGNDPLFYNEESFVDFLRRIGLLENKEQQAIQQ